MKEELQLGGKDELMIFFRYGHFYPIQGVIGIPLTKQAEDHAKINLGTLKVEDINGVVLWKQSYV